MSDAELADALERLLWIGEPDPKRDNEANLSYVAAVLEEHADLDTAVQNLVHVLAPSGGREPRARSGFARGLERGVGTNRIFLSGCGRDSQA